MPESKTKKPDIWEELRKPFPKAVVGKLPKAGLQLDYVGHAAVTDRLLSVDPEWTWEPLATNEHGLPVLDEKNGLWIKLTVGGVTRLGYGDGPDNKQRIGDALRNAAMRFGVALDLWTKDELESHVDNPTTYTPPKAQKPTIDTPSPEEPSIQIKTPKIKTPDAPITESQVGLIEKMLKQKHVTKGADIKALIKLITEEETHYKELTKGGASTLIDYLMKHTEDAIRTDLITYYAEHMEEVPSA